MSKNEIRKASINGPPYAKQGKNLISVCVLYNVIKLASGEGFEIKLLSQSLRKSNRILICSQAKYLKQQCCNSGLLLISSILSTLYVCNELER